MRPKLTIVVLFLIPLIAVSVSSNAIPTPSLNEVISAVFHAYYIIREQREQYEECVERQSVYCDMDIETHAATAKEEILLSLSATAATYEVSSLAICATPRLEGMTSGAGLTPTPSALKYP